MPVTVILSKMISPPREPIGGGFHVSVILNDFSAQSFESLDVQINGAGSDGAASGQRNAGSPTARHQRTQDQGRGAHRFDQFV